MTFRWDIVQRSDDGKIILLYRHERALREPFMAEAVDVLDVGGWGVLAQHLIEEGKRCTILDAFTRDQAYPDRVRSLPHVVGNARDPLCFPERSFDVVTCFETLEHAEGAAAVVRSIASWLRRGGHFVGTIPIPGRIHPVDEPGIEFLTPPQMRALLDDSGLTPLTIEPIGSIRREDQPTSIYFVARKD